MKITDICAKAEVVVVVLPVVEVDYKILTRKNFWFSWQQERHLTVYKLLIEGGNEILGVMSIDFIDAESRVHVHLLATSRAHVGENKKSSGVAGCLIAYACRQAMVRYAEPCVSLVPKTTLKSYYMKEYGMLEAGQCVCLFEDGMIDLILKYEV
jgi:hypothetical protein